MFVEDESDFVLLRRFAQRIGYVELASGTDLTAVASGGFSSWERVQALGWGLGRTLGQELAIAVIYDRDYWCDEEVAIVLNELEKTVRLAHIHRQKEIENYLLVPDVLIRALTSAIVDRRKRVDSPDQLALPYDGFVPEILNQITDSMRNRIQSQYVARRTDFLRKQQSKLDSATIASETMESFDVKWRDIESRMEIVPGKEVLRAFRLEIQSRFSVNLTDYQIVNAFTKDEVASDLRTLLEDLEKFRQDRPN